LKTHVETSRDYERRRCGKQSDDLCVGNAVDEIDQRLLKKLSRSLMSARTNIVGHRSAEIRDKKLLGNIF